ncbi:DNA/RNA non-specific endonuclease [Nisaea sediminum]|uniref:DNA/RNA non-specific endonuclease n=1 Tax=Nisaea sediminum TaxID=2775867 RepID=UPI00186932A6|nr:DNA/RNA non-specific endonuclease [Nisaea sediminum]
MTCRTVFLALIFAAGFSPVATADDGFPPDPAGRCARLHADTGIPAYKGDFDADERQMICHAGYLLSLNAGTLLPDWVLESVPKANLSGPGDRDKSSFKPDPQVVASTDMGKNGPLVVCSDDYTGSGYDRGHQAPAADFKYSQERTDESFYMTNMAPQIGIGFNRGIWRNLETQVRDWTELRGKLTVITGPVEKAPEFDVPVRGKLMKRRCGDREKSIAVPEAFFKIVYQDQPRRAIAFLLPNVKLDWHELPNYRTTVAHIEDLTGIDFFTRFSLRDQRVLETTLAPMWAR